MMVRIEAPHFVVGVILENYHVVKAPPIVRYMIGWTYDRVVQYARQKGWKLETS